MDAAMEIPQLTPSVDGKRRRLSATSADPVSKVLADEDLLMEILIRLGSPTALVHAALVCKRWLRRASDRAFLSHFRKRNPPKLLGFYFEKCAASQAARFFPTPPHPPELAGVIRRANFRLDPYWALASNITCCWNGRVHIMHPKSTRPDAVAVYSPLLDPRRSLAHLPPFPKRTAGYETYWSQLMYNEDAEAFYLQVESVIAKEERPEWLVHVDRLRKRNGDASWCRLLTLAAPQLSRMRFERIVLSGNKIYIPSAQSDVVVLDLEVTTISTIQLPPGLQYGIGDTEFAPADDGSGLYLIHAKKRQLCIWLHKGDTWLLVDNICLRGMVAYLRMSGCKIEDERYSPLRVNHLGNYAEFVFLEMGLCVLHLDIKCRQLRKVYEMTENGQRVCRIHPFMMICAPTFPALKGLACKKYQVKKDEEDFGW